MLSIANNELVIPPRCRLGGKTVTVKSLSWSRPMKSFAKTIVAVFRVITSDETIFHQLKMSHFNDLPMMKTWLLSILFSWLRFFDINKPCCKCCKTTIFNTFSTLYNSFHAPEHEKLCPFVKMTLVLEIVESLLMSNNMLKSLRTSKHELVLFKAWKNVESEKSFCFQMQMMFPNENVSYLCFNMDKEIFLGE